MAFTTAALTLVAAGMGAVSAIQQGKAQSRQAKTQARIAEQNQEMAEEQARAEKREGYENMLHKRQEVAGIIARQRAAGGASGAQLDNGSMLELNMDSREKGEADALALYQQGLDRAWNSEMQGWNFGNDAHSFRQQARTARASSRWNAASTLIGGMASAGSMFGSAGKAGQLVSSGGKHWDRALSGWSSTPVRH